MDLMRKILVSDAIDSTVIKAVALLDNTIRGFCAIILWLTFFAMLLPTLVNAILRYTTNSSLNWSVEIVQLVFPWFIMSGAVLAAQHARHIRVEVFINLLNGFLLKWVEVFIQLLIFCGCLAVSYVYLGLGQFEGGMEYIAGDVSFTSLGISQSWSYTALLVGYCLLGLSALSTVLRLLNQK